MSGFEPGIYVLSFSMNTIFFISSLLSLFLFCFVLFFYICAPCVALPELSWINDYMALPELSI